mmetsp:Transcript_47566/g.123172  ORF Transcript_47566/g.123172 Transcript_47566/m.123172 type:complete len:169 (+) Transcript_47566:2744-3250(+)
MGVCSNWAIEVGEEDVTEPPPDEGGRAVEEALLSRPRSSLPPVCCRADEGRACAGADERPEFDVEVGGIDEPGLALPRVPDIALSTLSRSSLRSVSSMDIGGDTSAVNCGVDGEGDLVPSSKASRVAPLPGRGEGAPSSRRPFSAIDRALPFVGVDPIPFSSFSRAIV